VFSRRVVTGKPLVSIVIPTQGKVSSSGSVHDALVLKAVKSIIEKTSYEHFEIDLVVDAHFDASVMTELAFIAQKKLRVHLWDRPFNFSQKMNYGVVLSRGDFVLLLNDDVEVINSTWLENMLALAQLPNAGMVGAMLYYEDDTIQHAGHAYYQGSPTHIGLGLPRGSKGPNSSFLVDRKVSGVTAACAVMPRHVFMEAGGFSALLPGNFNDVDLCLKVGSLGYDIYWTPNAELYHYESKTRDARVHFYELDVIEHRWAHRLDDKRFWSWNPRTKQI
jgi:glycosyltransferase involved in cell wall biosynthesis